VSTGESCGLGMNLGEVGCVVIVESAMKADDDLVSLSRAYQIGQCAELPVLRLYLSGSVEERMLQIIRKTDSNSISSLSKGNSCKCEAAEWSEELTLCIDDMKVFEDILIWGTRGLFSREKEIHTHPLFGGLVVKSPACCLDSGACKSLLAQVFECLAEGKEGQFGEGLSQIRWIRKTKEEAAHGIALFVKKYQRRGLDFESLDLIDMIKHINDPLLIAGYWEQLLGQEWTEKRRQEAVKDSARK